MHGDCEMVEYHLELYISTFIFQVNVIVINFIQYLGHRACGIENEGTLFLPLF